MSNPGTDLQRLVEILERILGTDHNCVITSPKRLPDRITGRLREHDVVVEVSLPERTMIIAVECRDRSRPVTVNQVESFYQKCLDTKIDRGVIVSSKGFYNTARNKAYHYAIDCLTLEESEKFNWLLARNIISYQITLLHHSWKVFSENNAIKKGATIELTDSSGNVLSEEVIANNARMLMDKVDVLSEGPGKWQKTFRIGGGDVKIRDKDSGKLHKLVFADITINYSVSEHSIPLRLFTYSNASGQRMRDLAVADMDESGILGSLAIVMSDEGGEVVFVPRGEKTK